MRRASVVATAVAVSTVAVLALGACSGQGSATAPRVGQVPEALAVQAYAVPSTATTTAFGASRDAIDVLSVSGVSILPGGATVGTASDDAKGLLAEAQEAGARAELLVLNADPSSGDFSGELAMTMLGDEAARTAVVAALADQVEADGWDGVQLDLESLPGEAAPLLTQFAVELRDALPDAAELSMALQPSTSVEGYEGLGYDLQGLQEVVDRFVLMAYDEHGAGFSAAGPVGGLPWVEQVLDALLEVLPAEVVDLGVAQYGYQWIGSSEVGSSLTVAQARRAAASTGSWDDEQGEYTASPADGTTVWWSDSRSLTLRADLAEERGLHGVAVWQLSTGDRFER